MDNSAAEPTFDVVFNKKDVEVMNHMFDSYLKTHGLQAYETCKFLREKVVAAVVAQLPPEADAQAEAAD